MDWNTFFFALFALIACAFAVAVLFTSNIVRMAFYLTICLGATAGLFFLAGAEFVGAMQLMIYVGGTLVLLIFGVMLTAQSRFVSMRTRGGDWIVSAVFGAMLFFPLLLCAIRVPDWNTPNTAVDEVALAESKATTSLGLALTGVRTDEGNGYLLPFVIVSVHLLVVLVGAAYMARTKKRADAEKTDD